MKIVNLEYSIVVTANDFNPTILNPDFLKMHNVVTDEWGWKIAGSPITTPPFAIVPYDSGVTISVETNKMQVVDRYYQGELKDSKIAIITKEYVTILPHVRFSAVGINFRSLVEKSDGNNFLKERFLAQGSWNSDAHKLEAAALTFIYPLEGRRFTLSLASGSATLKVDDKMEEKHGIIAGANFHRECQGYPCEKQVIEHIENITEDWNIYQKTLLDIIKDESEK